MGVSSRVDLFGFILAPGHDGDIDLAQKLLELALPRWRVVVG
jgi:hypothetical protein